jgi:hypothetical protein
VGDEVDGVAGDQVTVAAVVGEAAYADAGFSAADGVLADGDIIAGGVAGVAADSNTNTADAAQRIIADKRARAVVDVDAVAGGVFNGVAVADDALAVVGANDG